MIPPTIAQGLQRQQSAILRRGDQSDFSKIRQRHLYSTFLFAPGIGQVIQPGRYVLFSTPRGQQGQGYNNALTARETNWEQAGRVANETNLVVEGIGVDIRRAPYDSAAYPNGQVFGLTAGDIDRLIPPCPEDVSALAHGMVLAYEYLNEVVPIARLADLPFPGGITGFVEASRQGPIVQGEESAEVYGFAGTATGVGQRAMLPVTRNNCPPAFERRFPVPLFLPAGSQFQMSLHVPVAITLAGPDGLNIPAANRYTGALEVQVELSCLESFINRG